MADVLEQILSEARLRRSLPEPPVRRVLRQRAGLTQQEVALVLGVDRASIARYENGGRDPRGAIRVAYVALLTRLAKEVTTTN